MKDWSLHLTAVCWSDDANPSSGSKQNRKNIWVVAPMCTLCLNAIKNTHEMGLTFAALRWKKGPFINYTHRLLMQLVDMKLEQFKVLPPFSGMVSENW
eukprot:1216070-Ditylum_brightwellii.AAC.1